MRIREEVLRRGGPPQRGEDRSGIKFKTRRERESAGGRVGIRCLVWGKELEMPRSNLMGRGETTGLVQGDLLPVGTQCELAGKKKKVQKKGLMAQC